jgi:hypothetical protein
MPVCVGPSASAVHVAPTLTLNASTNYNENSGVLNATVTATGNRPITSVEFQWSNSATFTAGAGITISDWTAASTNTLIPQGTASTARNLTATSLANNTTFYVRFRTTNASGFVTTSSIGSSFKTYRDILVTFTSSSTWTNPVPTSGTSGLAITQLRSLVCRGGGGGGGHFVGGGGGGGNITTATTATISGNVSVTVGGGGGQASSGSTSSIGSVLSAAGGGGGKFGNFNGEGDGGASGNGNPGGLGAFDGGGGGGGVAGAGGNGGTFGPGGAGGAGISGNGEGGRGADQVNVSGPNGAANTGNGGGGGYDAFNPNHLHGDGGSGYAQFNYWGP